MDEKNRLEQIDHLSLVEREYLLRRANDHEKLGEKCDDQSSRLIHRRLQDLYEERAASITVVLSD